MDNVLKFTSIVNSNIFNKDFQDFKENNEIKFSNCRYHNGGIAVLYAPNGTGKSSLSDILANKENTSYKAKYNGNQINPDDNIFHIIKDQISRNIIKGNASDYIIGPNIKQEFYLEDKINSLFYDIFVNKLSIKYKNDYGIKSKTHFFLKELKNKYPLEYVFISDIVNNKSKGTLIDRDKIINYVSNCDNKKNKIAICDDKQKFIVDSNHIKLVEKILLINKTSIKKNADINKIEYNDVAIRVLDKYKDLDYCLVCDNPDFDGEKLLQQKKISRESIFNKLDVDSKKLLKNVSEDVTLDGNDPFNIKNIILNFISEGIFEKFNALQEELEYYINAIHNQIINLIFEIFEETDIVNCYSQLKDLKSKAPKIDSEELLYIEAIIKDNIEEEIKIERDIKDGNNFSIKLGGNEFLNIERENLHLSTGEQNFISLAFELLLARHSDKEFIVLDDPISSFDSIYKNKIAYCLIKFLENKKQIILTHNTDLIKLLEFQKNNCFNLYLFNNTKEGVNGFIPINKKEKKLLLSLADLINLFQNKNDELINNIIDQKLFLISMIPFLRGYSHIIMDGNPIYSRLSTIMHGYENVSLNISAYYFELFGFQFSDCIISTQDILSINFKDIDKFFIKEEEYPLLSDTLYQTLAYYHLRMKVENKLVTMFNLDKAKQYTLNQIFMEIFNSESNDDDNVKENKRKYRVFFTSRKTLINEFNHFEGNMNIFQPAIDITETSLQKEIDDIEIKLNKMTKEMFVTKIFGDKKCQK
jgi:hypothetical protein